MAKSPQNVVVITGCSSGIGLHTAVFLAKDNQFKVLATMRNLEKKETLEKAAGESLDKNLFIQELDISKEESILQFLKQTYEVEGRIDTLINNAAILQHDAFENISLQQMQSLFQTNFFGTMRITQEVVRKMKEQKSGHIIFISSICGFMDNCLRFCDCRCQNNCADPVGCVNSCDLYLNTCVWCPEGFYVKGQECVFPSECSTCEVNGRIIREGGRTYLNPDCSIIAECNNGRLLWTIDESKC